MQDNTAISSERIKVLKRLRDMLVNQREKFHRYLVILEQQENAIVNDNSEALEDHMLIEQQVVRDILTMQKVIIPLDTMYHRLYPEKKEDITLLQKSLSRLREQVLTHNAHNRTILIQHRDELKKKIDALRIPNAPRSVYAREASASMVDISC